jgi:tRNA pseudouridine38-40 synthase
VKPSPDTELVRTVDRSEIVPNDVYTASFFPEENYLFRVIGKGFLRYQIRLMMGTLFALGRGVITLDNLKGALTGEYWLPQNFIAPPSGLILQSVEYD